MDHLQIVGLNQNFPSKGQAARTQNKLSQILQKYVSTQPEASEFIKSHMQDIEEIKKIHQSHQKKSYLSQQLEQFDIQLQQQKELHEAERLRKKQLYELYMSQFRQDDKIGHRINEIV